jgi:hypothetical protein
MRLLSAVALLVLISVAPAHAQEVYFVSGTSTPEVKQAVLALREVDPATNYPLADISAAFVTLNASSGPELFVFLGNDYCGSGGCDYSLFEPGTTGWIRIGDWFARDVRVGKKDGEWNDLIFGSRGGNRTWWFSALDDRYEPITKVDEDVGVPY